jgi:hypothetical protein
MGTAPEGVLLSIDTPALSGGRNPAEGAIPSIVLSSGLSNREDGRLVEVDFRFSPSSGGTPRSPLSTTLSALGDSKTAPQFPQRTAWAEFSVLHEGQIMI